MPGSKWNELTALSTLTRRHGNSPQRLPPLAVNPHRSLPTNATWSTEQSCAHGDTTWGLLPALSTRCPSARCPDCMSAGRISEGTYSMWAPLATRALTQSRLPERAALWMGVSPSQSWNNRRRTRQIRSDRTRTLPSNITDTHRAPRSSRRPNTTASQSWRTHTTVARDAGGKREVGHGTGTFSWIPGPRAESWGVSGREQGQHTHSHGRRESFYAGAQHKCVVDKTQNNYPVTGEKEKRNQGQGTAHTIQRLVYPRVPTSATGRAWAETLPVPPCTSNLNYECTLDKEGRG